jgi:aspartyl/glutamyl-tRNA(Asn/Gln) amidotransferase C subunit
VLRADEAAPSLPREEALAGAPEARDEFFVVPRVVET